MSDRDTVFRALHDAIGWQEGLADAWPACTARPWTRRPARCSWRRFVNHHG